MITRSATIFLGLVAVAFVVVAIAALRNSRTGRARTVTHGIIAAALVVLASLTIAFRSPILSVLGKSDSGTGRTEIWREVIALAQQRQIVGWGWLSYWIPWIAPFKNLKKAGGVQPPHAHNAWLDVWLQLGVAGLIIFGALVFATLVRAYLLSVDRVITHPGNTGSYSWITALPLLVFTAQLVQSLAESRLLLEGGWMLLVIWAVRTKLHPFGLEQDHLVNPGRELGRVT